MIAGVAEEYFSSGEEREAQLRGFLEIGYTNLSESGRARAFRLMQLVINDLDHLRERNHLLAQVEHLLDVAREPERTDTDDLVDEVADRAGVLGGSALGLDRPPRESGDDG